MACGVWEYINGGWNQTVLPFSGTFESQQPTYNTDPVIPAVVLNQCPGMGGIWRAQGGQGSTNWAIATGAGEYLFNNEENNEFCCSISYASNVSNSNGVLSGSGFSGYAFSAGGSEYDLTGVAAPFTFEPLVVSGLPEATTLSPRISMGQAGALLQYDVAYETPPSLAAIAGAYTMFRSGNLMSIAMDGTVDFQDSTNTGCTFTGKVSILDPFHSVYRLNVTATNCTGPSSWNGVPEQGIIAVLPSLGSGGTVVGGTSFTDSNGVPALNLFLSENAD